MAPRFVFWDALCPPTYRSELRCSESEVAGLQLLRVFRFLRVFFTLRCLMSCAFYVALPDELCFLRVFYSLPSAPVCNGSWVLGPGSWVLGNGSWVMGFQDSGFRSIATCVLNRLFD